ncbi:MaoC/PaaZ C-terminal domain-containing protein [Enterovirga sp. CN4-39]|uniref:MaoC/PaaZ C-terminal domain-containing protein n=1 Tax=Enterovirga sp. CN4-39 TaxID=3400910 RepID=UPI003BFB2AA8
MAFTYESLMAYEIPEVRQRLTERDTVFYALSVGFGQDPMDTRQLDFVDAHRSLKAVPTQSVVLAHPGFWMADPKTGIDAVRVVHGEQRIAMHRPLPVSGEVVGKTRIVGLVDKGPGRGALMYSEKEVRDAGTGDLLATTRSTTFLRGDGGFGGPEGPVEAPHALPDTSPDETVDVATRPEQALYYRLNGDDNPLHANPSIAEKAGFPRPILHGLCTLGVVGHALLRILGDYDAARFRSLAMRFSAPVFPGETIRVEIWRDGSFRASVPERGVVAVNNGLAVFASSAG